MRLTLRTLLAYRDGVLDPKDAALLEAKIRESSMAQQISARIEEGMRNRKLAPIPVDAREFGFEANMVAEFLDDTISMETLPEMERKCLEFNTLLSEIGSCHQILSRALTIPAAIPNSLRQRIRDLPNHPNAKSSLFTNKSLNTSGQMLRLDSSAAVASKAADPSSPTVASTAESRPIRKSRIELRESGIELDDGLGRSVPEYLIGSDRSWMTRAAMALLLVLALIVVGAFAVGPLERVAKLLSKPEGGMALVPNDRKKPPGISAIDENPKAIKPLEEAMDAEDAPIIEESVGAPPPGPALAINDPNAKPTSLLPSDGLKKEPNAKPEPPQTVRQMQWLPDSKASSESIVLTLGKRDGLGANHWKRMHPGDRVRVGERVIVPPAQRTEMRIEPGIRWLCAGDNDMLLAADGKTTKVMLYAGRSLIFATPDATAIDVDCNGVLLSIRFNSPDASAALELNNVWSPTTDAMLQQGSVEVNTNVRLIGVQGKLDYTAQSPGNPSSQGTLDVGQFVDWEDGAISKTQELLEAPWWLQTSFERPIDQLAATDLQRALAGVDPDVLENELLELTNHRRGETAALAVRTRMMIGKYDNLFTPEGVLNRKGLHSHWASILAQIPQSFGQMEHRELLVNTLRNEAGTRANTILSLLVPKSDEQLAAGADKLLVESLSSSAMDERILAIHQLSNITGKSLGFQPDKNSVDAIQQWRKLLSKNEIRYPESKAPKNGN
jgi:hypothetical protein